jgi:hypothetical protein
LELIKGFVAAICVELGGVVAQPIPEIDCNGGNADIGTRSVCHGLAGVQLNQQAALVAKCHA